MNQFNSDNKNICIDFSLFPFCFRCVKTENFTNKLKNANQFFEKFKRLFETDIPALIQFSFDNVKKETKRHSHAILTDTKEYSVVIDVVKALFKSDKGDDYSDRDFELFLNNNINEYHVWQLGISSGIRLFGIRRSNVFSVLFIDYHHLIYPNKNYNQENYDIYDFCPITNYKGGISDG